MTYPELQSSYAHLIQIAKLYEVDLTKANQSEKDHLQYGNRFGAQEGDINLDLCGAIDDFIGKRLPESQSKSMIDYVIFQLEDWDYESNDIAEAIANSKLEVERID